MKRFRLLLPVFLLLAGCSGSGSIPVGYTVTDFTLTDQNGATVRKQDLEGKVWVADFFFTRCTGPCPQLSGTMARLQQEMAGEPDFRLVSVTVDPEHDTPAILEKYGERYGADGTRWLFLTGPEATVYSWIRESFKLGVERNKEPGAPVGSEALHSTRLVLIDQQGQVRGYFDGRQVDDEGQPVNELPKLKKAARRLMGESDTWPAVNAALNGTSAILLAIGFLAIRRGKISLHKSCMLAALAVSAIFLASYLYLHLVVRHGQPTRFAEQAPDAPSWVGTLYLVILLTHTVLAAVAAPLALITAYLALRGRFKQHKRIAWWTFPIWGYVSVTGVVVYWMLYRLYP